jgi:Metallo-peptidase family M12B Reprolysin-like/Secretion system C-terminal sorting domain
MQSIISLSNLTEAQLDNSQLAKLNKLKSSQLHDSFLLVEVENLAATQVNSQVRLSLPFLPCPELTFTAVNQQYSSESDYYWYGTINSNIDAPCNGGSITLMAKNGEKFGVIIFDDYSYEFQEIGNGIQAFCRFKIEQVNENQCASDSNDVLRQNIATPTPQKETQNRTLPCQGNCEVRVLVLWTQAAANIEANINNRIALAIAQTNQSYANSLINSSNIRVVLAGSQQVNFVETNEAETDAVTISTDPTIQALRTTFEADLVVLLTNGSYNAYQGAVSAIGPNFATSYAIVQTNAATTARFVFTHELGHLFGSKHQFHNVGTIEHGYVFKTGFIFTKKRYTIMASAPGGKTYEQVFSNPTITIKNKAAGTIDFNNNSLYLSNVGCTVANFFPNQLPNFIASIDAVQQDCYSGLAEAITQCGTAPYTYLWESSIDGAAYQAIGTTEISNFNFNCQSNTFLNLRLTVTDAAASSITVYHHLEIDGNYPAKAPPPKISNPDANQSTIIKNVSPNPAKPFLNIDLDMPTSENITLSIIDIYGTPKKMIYNAKLQKGKHLFTINTSQLKPGMYQIILHTSNKTEYRQFLVIE